MACAVAAGRRDCGGVSPREARRPGSEARVDGTSEVEEVASTNRTGDVDCRVPLDSILVKHTSIEGASDELRPWDWTA
jgi:hypothetical protein